MNKFVLLSLSLIFLSTMLFGQNTTKNVEIKINYLSYKNNSLHYKMPVIVELRSGSTPLSSEIISQKSGILNIYGNVNIDFSEVPNGDYWILVRISGFFPICTNTKVNLSEDGTKYDFTTSSDKAVLGSYAMAEVNGVWMVRADDLDGDASIGAYNINELIPNIGKSIKSEYPVNDMLVINYASQIIGDQEWIQKNLDI